jgi:hypothetical protein
MLARAAVPSHRRIMNGRSAAGHGREKRDFAGTFELGLVAHMVLIDRGADDLRILESMRVK